MVAGDSDAFFSSFGTGETAAPKGLVYSIGGLLDTLGAGGASLAFGVAVPELEENFELRLDTQELLRPGAAGFGSF